MAVIGHLDMDAFFASVEEREKPWLKGAPVVVGADPRGGEGRGIVATANYKAREYGIHSAMPISMAWNLSQQKRKKKDLPTAFITPRFGRYSVASQEVTNIVLKHVPKIQKTGSDEMYLELSHISSYEEAARLAQRLKQDIKEKTKLIASIGIGPNKMIAKMASDFQKPNGLTVVSERDVMTFIAPLPVRNVPGIGPKMEEKLARLQIKTVSDLQKISKEKMVKRFGKWGSSLYEKARGRGSVVLSSCGPAKSIGVHRTFQKDTYNMHFVMEKLAQMSEEIVAGLQRKGFGGFRTTVLTVRFADFETKQRSISVKEPMQTAQELELRAIKLLLPFFEHTENPHDKAIRMVGLRVEKLR